MAIDYLVNVLANLTDIRESIEKDRIVLDIPACEGIARLVNTVCEKEIGMGEHCEKVYKALLQAAVLNNDKENILNVFHTIETLFLSFKFNNMFSIDRYTAFEKMQYYRNKLRNIYNSDKEQCTYDGKGCVYTVITGNYDKVVEPNYIDPELDYILFTNNKSIKSDIWTIRYLDNKDNLDDARLSRISKIMPHKYLDEYDYSIYIDGNCYIKGDLREFIRKYSEGASMLCCNHVTRDCIYQDELACEEYKKDKVEVMRAQIERYREEGFPEHYGLIAGCFLVRNHKSAKMRNAMEMWWNEMQNGSRRDQLSFNYVCWKCDYYYDTCDLYNYDNEYFEIGGHN